MAQVKVSVISELLGRLPCGQWEKSSLVKKAVASDHSDLVCRKELRSYITLIALDTDTLEDQHQDTLITAKGRVRDTVKEVQNAHSSVMTRREETETVTSHVDFPVCTAIVSSACRTLATGIRVSFRFQR